MLLVCTELLACSRCSTGRTPTKRCARCGREPPAVRTQGPVRLTIVPPVRPKPGAVMLATSRPPRTSIDALWARKGVATHRNSRRYYVKIVCNIEAILCFFRASLRLRGNRRKRCGITLTSSAVGRGRVIRRERTVPYSCGFEGGGEMSLVLTEISAKRRYAHRAGARRFWMPGAGLAEPLRQQCSEHPGGYRKSGAGMVLGENTANALEMNIPAILL